MDIIFLCVVVFLLLLAIFDLYVGVSNDAVNFLNSSIGAKAGSFKRILTIAAIGVFMGAAMSNGMMDIARHGIFKPECFSFYDIMCIFMAVMVTDIIMLDIFNSLGMPTSTTVSMVFELLGATFIVAVIKMSDPTAALTFGQLLNTEKALQVIIGIFLSVAIAFVFGLIVQFLARTIFSFNYRNSLKWKIGIYGGICSTAIIYFLLIKGLKDMSFMTPEAKEWVSAHTTTIIGITLVATTLLMQLLHCLKVNVLKVICLMGTFALAMAFAGNDLVNFIGVPLTGLASFQDFTANGGGDVHGHLMGVLNGPSNTPVYYLVIAGLIMVISLVTSKKAHRVSQTEIGLGSQNGGDEMFGSSRIGRRLVRWALSLITWVQSVTPLSVRNWFSKRFNVDETIIEHGASFDLIRGSINLVLAGALIAIGTSMKLPLSTTFVTFMVAMGTSLSDKAWGRESAVFRITGVISVIGGWFITAVVAFMGAGLVVSLMHFGGTWMMFALGILTIVILVHSNRRFNKKKKEEKTDDLFQTILASEDTDQTWDLLQQYIAQQHSEFMVFARDAYLGVTDAFVNDNVRALDKTEALMHKRKNIQKSSRRKETLCLRKLPRALAMEKSTWFYLGNNCCMSMLYNLRRITEICKEHTENNFHPLPQDHANELTAISGKIEVLFNDILDMMSTGNLDVIRDLRKTCEDIKNEVSAKYHHLYEHLRDDDASHITVLYVYFNTLQETRELLSTLRKYLRAYAKLRNTNFSGQK